MFVYHLYHIWESILQQSVISVNSRPESSGGAAADVHHSVSLLTGYCAICVPLAILKCNLSAVQVSGKWPAWCQWIVQQPQYISCRSRLCLGGLGFRLGISSGSLGAP